MMDSAQRRELELGVKSRRKSTTFKKHYLSISMEERKVEIRQKNII
jgi:hypothetical protein